MVILIHVPIIYALTLYILGTAQSVYDLKRVHTYVSVVSKLARKRIPECILCFLIKQNALYQKQFDPFCQLQFFYTVKNTARLNKSIYQNEETFGVTRRFRDTLYIL